MSNSQRSIKQSETINRDELSDCLILLWSNKIIIFLSACFFIFCAFLYVSQKKTIWNVNGIVSVEISSNVNNDYLTSQIGDLKAFSAETLFNTYNKEFSSLDNKNDFLKNNYYQHVSANNLTINSMNEISLSNYNEKNIYQILANYNKYISDIALKKSEVIIFNKIKTYNKNLESEYNNLLMKTKNSVNIERERIKYAIKIAQAAKVITPEYHISNRNDIFNINLGVLGLKEKLEIYSTDNILPVIEPTLINIKNKKDKLTEILRNKKSNIIDNSYIIKISKVHPLQSTSNSFIVMISLILGIIFGSFLIVIIDFIKNFKK